MNEDIATALGDLFGRPVQCQYVPTGQPGKPAAAPRPAQAATLSTADRAELASDPAVKPVLDFFAGSLFEVRHAGPPPDQAEGPDA